MKKTYQEQVRSAAVNRLTGTMPLTGRQRRECLRAMDRVVRVRVGSEPKSDSLRLQQRFSKRPIASLGKWHKRVTRRLATVENGLNAAIEAGFTKLVDVLSVKRDRFREISEALRIAINRRNNIENL